MTKSIPVRRPVVQACLALFAALVCVTSVNAAEDCGNSFCDVNETPDTCPGDCFCGDLVCSVGEDCDFDCACGDGACSYDEDWKNCQQDCCPDPDRCELAGAAPPAEGHPCSPVLEDADEDLVPDQLEHDLAHKFFPDIRLRDFDADLKQTYAYNNRFLPYSVQPWTDEGPCAEPLTCLEIRYGTPYLYDCGIANCGSPGTHQGDSEFYAALVYRASAWSDARNESNHWYLIRDFAAAHWGAWEQGPFDFDGSEAWRYGLCDECNECPPCEQPAPRQNRQVLYAEKGKHALYHEPPEVGPYPHKWLDYVQDRGLLQNIGDLQGVTLDAEIAHPYYCQDYDIQSGYSFGDSTDYLRHFTFPFPWYFAEDSCSSVEGTGISYYTEEGCGGREYQDGADGNHISWDGGGCSFGLIRPALVKSSRDEDGFCRDEWPEGVVLMTLAPIERSPVISECSPCEEELCVSASVVDLSYHRTSDCTGWEFFDTSFFSGLTLGSWDGEGCIGTWEDGRTLGSYRDSAGYCREYAEPYQTDAVRVYRDGPTPTNCAVCGESSCFGVTESGTSYFTAADCAGDEYALPGSSLARRSWDGLGCSGNLVREVEVATRRDPQGFCHPASIVDGVRIYRAQQPTLPTCNGCQENSCTSVSGGGISYFADPDCEGDEYFAVVPESATRRSWNGTGCAGDLANYGRTMRSYKQPGGSCFNFMETMGGLSRVYRPESQPPTGCRGCPDVDDGSFP